MTRLNMGIPTAVLDELISFVDSDNCGYIEMPEFVELIQPSNEDLRLSNHDEEDRLEIERLLSGPVNPGPYAIPEKELHPVVNEYLRHGQLGPSMNVIKDGLDRKASRLRDIFLKWDHNRDGFINATVSLCVHTFSTCVCVMCVRGVSLLCGYVCRCAWMWMSRASNV